MKLIAIAAAMVGISFIGGMVLMLILVRSVEPKRIDSPHEQNLSGLSNIDDASSTPPPNTSIPNPEIVTQAEANRFGEEFELASRQMIETQRKSNVNSFIDYRALVENMMRDFTIPEENRERLFSFVIKNVKDTNSVADEMTLANTANYTFIASKKRDGVWYVIFRKFKNGSLFYHELPLIKKNGIVKAYDFFGYANGDYSFKHLKTLVGSLDQLAIFDITIKSNSKTEFVAQHLQEVQQLYDCMYRPKIGIRAAQIFDQLPIELQTERSIAILRWLSTVDDPKQKAETTRVLVGLDVDPVVKNWIHMNNGLYSQNIDQAINAIDKVDDALGGDPYLELFRCEQYLVHSEYSAAAAAFDRAERNGVPQLPYFKRLKVSILVLNRNHAGAVEYMRESDPSGEMDWNELLRSPFFDRFKQSPSFQDWKSNF